MNKMIGLLVKDFLQLKSYKKNFLTSILIYAIIIFINTKEESMLAIGASMIMFLFSVYAMATFNYDEKNHSDKYTLTMPLIKKEIVLEKYVLGIISIVLGLIVGLFVSKTISLISKTTFSEFTDSLSITLGVVYGLSLMQCIQIPFIYKYGAEKGRLQIYIIMMGIALLFALIYILFPNIDITFLNGVSASLLFILLIVFNYFISFRISLKIYSKKEL